MKSTIEIQQNVFSEDISGLYFYFWQSYPLVWCTYFALVKMFWYSRVKFIEKRFIYIGFNLMFIYDMYISASFVYLKNHFTIYEIGCFYINES